MANVTGLNQNAFKNPVELEDLVKFNTYNSPSAVRNDVSQVLPSSTVGDYISVLEKSIEELNATVHVLGGRLSSVLLPHHFSGDTPEPPAAPPMCPLSSCLDDSVRAVVRTTDFVRFLIDSVQL